MEQDHTQHLQKDLQDTSLRKCPKCDTIFSAIAYCPNDGSKLEYHQGDSLPQTLFAEKYEVLEEIGRGGMGTVYRVKQVLLDKVLALKIIPSHHLSEQLAVRFQREAKTMATLNHPNLGRILDFGIWLNQPFMVMEYVNGLPLSKLISERVIPPAQAIELFRQVLNGLQHAHDKGVLHRDIKPSNIMVLSEEGQNKAILLDFGIAKRIETDLSIVSTQALTRTGEMIGSPLYMSPEQARGERLTERSDLYSLGCALFESLTGTPPFVGKTTVETLFLHMEHTPPSLKEAALGREFAPELEKLVRKLLAKNPEDRFASAEELRRALSLCLSHEQPQEKIETKKSGPIVPIALIAVSSITIISAATFLLQQREKSAQPNAAQLTEGNAPLTSESPIAIPDEFVNDKDQTGMRKQGEGVGSLMTGTGPVQQFYNKVLSKKHVDSLITNKNLVRLSLPFCIFPKSMLAKLPPSLEYLELHGTKLLNDDYELIASNSNLRGLNLRFNIVNAKALHNLRGLKKLEFLDLNGTHVDAEALKELSDVKTIKSLILSKNYTIDDSAVPIITGFPQLQWLDVSNTGMTSKAISQLAVLPKLTKLNARQLSFQNDDMKAFNQFQTLEALSLAGNSITADGLKLLPVFKTIRELDLSGTQLENDAVPYLLRYKNLKVLHISRTDITQEGFLKLAQLPLQAIWAKQIKLSTADARSFLKSCPTCQCVYYGEDKGEFYTRADYQKEKFQQKSK